MKATELNLIQLLQKPNVQFVIPVYQRNYDWTKKECELLFSDTLKVGKEGGAYSHFIGSIVFIHDSAYSSGVNELTIIDGQQRLTTITLMWIAVYHKAKKLGDTKLADMVYRMYLINEFLDDDAKIKLKPTQNNDKAFKHLLNGEEPSEYPEYSSIVENYTFFYERITDENIETLKEGIARLLFVEISLERDKDDPQRIFESLNSTGLALNQGDLIRNYVLMGLKPKEQNTVYEKYWMPIERNTTLESSKRSELSDFVRHYLTLKSQEIPRKDQVYEVFKEKFKFKNFEELEEILKEVKNYSKFYFMLINPRNEPKRKIREQIQYINRLEINVSYPFLLRVYDDYEKEIIDEKTLINVLEFIQSFVFRRFIVNLPTNALNKIFARLYNDIKKDSYLESLQISLLKRKGQQRFPFDHEIEKEVASRDLYNIKRKNKSYLFHRLENHKNKEPVQIEGNPDITIEHIFPQTPSKKWREEIAEGEFADFQTLYVHTLPNLTLSGNNGSLGNRIFKEKRDLEEKGYKASRLYLNKYLSDLDNWNVSSYKKRAEILVDRFKSIWQFPDIEINENTREEEINIFETESPKGKTLDYVVFFEEKIDVESFKDFYIEILHRLFDINPSIFVDTDLKDRIGIAKDKSKFIRSEKLGETYFIDINLGSESIFARVRNALETMDIFDELFIKFKTIKED